jgi:broad specificity phosphatase PhoE
MGERRRDDRISVVLCSDLRRAVETIEIAFEDTVTNRLLDWRLRECDYGDMTRMPVDDLHREMTQHVDDPYPGGESWRQAVLRVSKVFDDIATRWSGERVLIVGHRATRWALDHVVAGVPLEDLVQEDFDWRAGWEYRLQP